MEFVNPLYNEELKDTQREDDVGEVGHIRINGHVVFRDIGMKEYEVSRTQRLNASAPFLIISKKLQCHQLNYNLKIVINSIPL